MKAGSMPKSRTRLPVGRQVRPEPTLADHGATMRVQREKASDDPGAPEEIEAWGRRRERRLPVLRKLVALLGRHGTVGRTPTGRPGTLL